MGRFRKRPLEVEAMQFKGPGEALGDLEYTLRFDDWLAEHCGESGRHCRYVGDTLQVTTIHGDIAVVRRGDWVVREPMPGSFYPVKPDIFKETYEAA